MVTTLKCEYSSWWLNLIKQIKQILKVQQTVNTWDTYGKSQLAFHSLRTWRPWLDTELDYLIETLRVWTIQSRITRLVYPSYVTWEAITFIKNKSDLLACKQKEKIWCNIWNYGNRKRLVNIKLHRFTSSSHNTF